MNGTLLSARAEKRRCILYSHNTCAIYHAEIGLSKLPGHDKSKSSTCKGACLAIFVWHTNCEMLATCVCPLHFKR